MNDYVLWLFMFKKRRWLFNCSGHVPWELVSRIFPCSGNVLSLSLAPVGCQKFVLQIFQRFDAVCIAIVAIRAYSEVWSVAVVTLRTSHSTAYCFMYLLLSCSLVCCQVVVWGSTFVDEHSIGLSGYCATQVTRFILREVLTSFTRIFK